MIWVFEFGSGEVGEEGIEGAPCCAPITPFLGSSSLRKLSIDSLIEASFL